MRYRYNIFFISFFISDTVDTVESARANILLSKIQQNTWDNNIFPSFERYHNLVSLFLEKTGGRPQELDLQIHFYCHCTEVGQ